MGRTPRARAAALGLCLFILGSGAPPAFAQVPTGPRLTLLGELPGPLSVRWQPPLVAAGAPRGRIRLLEAAGWRDAGTFGAQPPPIVTVPAGALAMELLWEAQGEDGQLRAVALWPGTPPGSEESREGVEPVVAAAQEAGRRLRAAAAAEARVEGRLLYRDRAFGTSGYLSTSRVLPLRHVVVELRRTADAVVLAAATTGPDGTFALSAALAAPTAVQVVAVSRVLAPGVDLSVLDAVGPGGDTSGSQRLTVLATSLAGLAPESTVVVGDLLLHDATGSSAVQAFNLLDTALDAVDLLADPAFLGAPPDSGSVPPITWAPAATYSSTDFTGTSLRVASPGSGDTDGWADALLLAAIGRWVLQTYGRVDQAGTPALTDGEVDPRLAYGNGSALAFAAVVRAHRAQTRQAVDGSVADSGVSQVVDLGFPPPLGFTSTAQGAVDLETRALAGGDTVLTRGQLGALNVAAMLWDLADGASTGDGLFGDDDPVDQSGAQWFALATAGMAALPPQEPLTFEDFHAAWLTAYGDAAALTAIAVAQGGTALALDAAEPDESPAGAPLLQPWVQPAPSISGKVVLGELALGDRDAVELTNTGAAVADLSNWSVVTRRNGFGTGAPLTATLPTGTLLHPGRSLVLHEGGTSTDNGTTDLYFSGWSIPWRERDDGACTLRNAGGTAVDFVRWAGGGGSDPSSEPVPAGQSFSGVLLAPPIGATLARDSLATDTNVDLDFTPRQPTLRLPNLRALNLRRLYPRGDLDHVRVALAAGKLTQVQAERAVDDAQPLLAQLDGSGQVVVEAGPVNSHERGALLQLFAPGATVVPVRLRQNPVALTVGGASLVVWQPAYAASLLAPLQIAARSQQIDPLHDPVDVSWANAGSYDSVRVAVDGVVAARVIGSFTAAVVPLDPGHHVVTARPVSAGVAGAVASAGVFVGPTPCALRLWLMGPELPQVLQQVTMVGFALNPLGYDGPVGFRDAAVGASGYELSDEATLTLADPVDLTSDSRLEFVHAVHLADDGDIALVEASLDDGFHWMQLATFHGADHSGQGGDPANWTDGILTPGDWVHESLPLGAFAGERVRVRFRRVSNASGVSFGWTLDNVDFGAPPAGHLQWIAPEGDDGFGCGHPERAWRTIGAAVNASALGDTIALTAGTFTATTPVVLDGAASAALLPVPAGIAVRGSGSEATILDGGAAPWALVAGASTGIAPADTTALVSGLRIQGAAVGARVDGCTLRLQGIEMRGCGTGVRVDGGRAVVESALVAQGGVGALLLDGALELWRTTFASLDTAIVARPAADTLRVHRSILAFATAPLLTVPDPSTSVRLGCNDLFSFGGLTAGSGVTDSLALVESVVIDPWFCDRTAGDFHLAMLSPLADLPGCGLVGGLGVACAVATRVEPGVPVGRTRLPPNVPNPFNPSTSVTLELGAAGLARVQLFDSRGRLVRSLHDGPLPAGRSAFPWDGRDQAGRAVASGVYWVRAEVSGSTLARPIALIR